MRLKKILSLLVAVVMLLSVGVAAMAEETTTVAKISGVEYVDFVSAMTAANAMTGSVTVEIYGAVEFIDGMELKGNYDSISFVGVNDNAKITINQTAGGDYLEAHGKNVAFTDLMLAKANPAWAGNSGHMGNYFSVQGGTATYTDCTFPNGACTSGGTATYNNCTFKNTSEYGLWVYDDALVTVNGGTIDSKKGIKVYSEDETTVTSTITVQNATFTENVTAKPAVAIGYAESVTLIGNTYNNQTGVIELDSGSDADCNGITFVAKDASGNDIASTITAVDRSNNNAACGAFVTNSDGITTIYTSVSKAAQEAAEGDTVTLLYDSAETVELTEGVVLDKNGFTADGITVDVAAVAYIGEQGYETVQAAIDAAQNGETVTICAGEYSAINISNKNITIQGTVGDNGELLTTIKGGNPAIKGHSFNGTIKDIKIVDAWKVMYAEPAGNVTVDNVYVTGATYGFHLVAYSPDLTWEIKNSYMDLAWANSFGVYEDGNADIIIKGNEFISTNPYYSDYGALHVNSFLPNVTIEENIFRENAKIYIDSSVTDTSNIKISKNYHADGVENAFADDDEGITVKIDSYYTAVDEDGNLTDLVEVVEPAGDIKRIYITANYNNSGRHGIFGQADNVVATESFEVKLYSDNTLVGTAKLVDTEKVLLNGKSRSISWHILIGEDNDSWWNNEWVGGSLNINALPDKAELWVDGVKVSEGSVELNDADASKPVCAAVVDDNGNVQSFVAGSGWTYTQTNYYDAFKAALANGGNIVMLRDVALTSGLPIATDTTVTLDLNGYTISTTSNIGFQLKSGSAFTVKDTSAEQDGLIKVENSGGRAIDLSANDNTKFTLENGNIWSGKEGIYAGCDTANVIINGGSVICDTANADSCAINMTRGTATVTGGTFSSDVTKYCADGYAAIADLNGNYIVGKAPTATVNNLGIQTIPAGEYNVWDGSYTEGTTDMPLSFVMQFLADETADEVATSPYADWYADFVITFDGLENDSFIANGCYLAGFYGDFGWVKVPVDGMTIEEGARYPVMLGVGLGQKYDYICSGVKDFKCALYLTPEILEANPNLTVNLELAVVDNSKGSDAATEAIINNENVYKVTDYDYVAEDFEIKNASGKVSYRAYVTNTDARKAVQIDLENVKAEESLVVEMYSGETKISTTTLKEAKFPVDATGYTVNAVWKGEASGSWDTVWHAELTENNIPDTIKVYADGTLTDTFTHSSGTIFNDKLAEYKDMIKKDEITLDTKASFVRNIKTTNAAGEERYQVILFAGIDSLKYDSVGFEITVNGETRVQTTKKVYTSYTAAGVKYTPDAWGENCNYIISLPVNFKPEMKDSSVTFRPFAVTLDGETLWGPEKTIDKVYNK